LSDLRSDLSFGSDQFYDRRKEVRRQIRQLIERGHDVTITGHSLGGGLAQGFAADLVDEILREYSRSGQEQRPRGRLRLVTFNALGGKGLQDIVDRRDRQQRRTKSREEPYSGLDRLAVTDLDPRITQTYRVLRRQIVEESVHYRTRGDVVSRLGRHYGQVIDIDGPGAVQPPTAHRMSTVRNSLDSTNPLHVCANESQGLRIADWVT
jgi:hypothetical protein